MPPSEWKRSNGVSMTNKKRKFAKSHNGTFKILEQSTSTVTNDEDRISNTVSIVYITLASTPITIQDVMIDANSINEDELPSEAKWKNRHMKNALEKNIIYDKWGSDASWNNVHTKIALQQNVTYENEQVIEDVNTQRTREEVATRKYATPNPKTKNASKTYAQWQHTTRTQVLKHCTAEQDAKRQHAQ